MKICGTGHRPSSLGDNGYHPDTFALLVTIAGGWLDRNPRVTEVISGMTLGWDQALAVAAMDRLLPVHAYLPFEGQADKWPTRSVEFYSKLLQQCASRRIICPGGYAPEKMQRRNEAMADDADLVLALWNGTAGGTGNCVAYALMEGKEIVNLWDEFAAWA